MNFTDSLIVIVKNPLFHITFFGGIIFMLVGFVMNLFPPKNINYLYGYRTLSSMKNKERWNFAQKYSSAKIIQYGLILSLSCILAFITNFDNFTNMIIGLGLLIVTSFLLFLNTEKALKNQFDK